ncbi:CYIR protein, partial [Plasmodium cynomolgi strain B]
MSGVRSQGDPGTNSIVLASEQFYNNLDREHEDLSNYSNHCDIKTWGKKNEHQLKEICKKFVRYLETSMELNFVDPAYDVCILLNYWLYDKLTKIFPGENNSEYIRKAFGSLQLVWHNLYYYSGKSNHNKCNPNFKTVNHQDWDKRKKLYDYYVDYDYLSKMAIFHHDKCEYYKKINEMSSLYEYFKGKCLTEEYNCPHFFDKFQIESREYKLENLGCQTQMEQEISADAAKTRDSRSY